MGVIVEAGQAKQDTTMCVPSKNFVEIGIVTSIEKAISKRILGGGKVQKVSVKIEPMSGESLKMYGRFF